MNHLVTVILLVYLPLSVIGQTSEVTAELPDQASPFTAVKWHGEEPLVEIEGIWYRLLAINTLSSKQIISFCKEEYSNKWQKRFAEDLVEVLIAMKEKPDVKVQLKLEKDGSVKNVMGEMTYANRQEVAKKHRALMNRIKSLIKIDRTAAIEDLSQLKSILETESSYLNLSGFDYQKGLGNIEMSIGDSIRIQDFGFAIQKLIGELGDRHASVLGFWEINKHYLPFAVAPYQDKVIAVMRDSISGGFDTYLDNFRYLKSIGDVPIDEFLKRITVRNKHAPSDARFTKSVTNLRYLDFQYDKLGILKTDSVLFTFTDGEKNKILKLPLSLKRISWYDVSRYDYSKMRSSFKEKEYAWLFERKAKNIAYIRLPQMLSEDDHPKLFEMITYKMEEFHNTTALVIDIRHNGGGTRELLMKLAPYFISPDAEPWVANVAKIRNNQHLSEDIESMQSRYLFNYNSDHLTNVDRASIDSFMKNFKASWSYDEDRFSDYFYMILSHARGKNHYYYNKPVYILMNERSFSAASVFASALKGLPNVTLVGVNTDGSSGRSRRQELTNSKIRIKLSSMISFQRNGKTLDMNGTAPDIIIERDLDQVLGKRDTQLEKLLKIIKKH